MDKLFVQVIGSGDAFGNGGRMNTCFFVHTNSINFLIDCGATSLVGLKKVGLSSDNVDAIFISHFHGDHIAGIAFLLCEAKNYFKREKELHIIGPKGIQEKVETITNAMYENTTQSLPFNVCYIEAKTGETSNLSDLEFTYFSVVHSAASFPHGIRFKIKEKIIAYSGDTEWTDNLYKLSYEADIFICECNNYMHPSKNHMDYMKLKTKRSGFNCKKILLTHLGTDMLKNKNAIEMEIAEDKKKIYIS